MTIIIENGLSFPGQYWLTWDSLTLGDCFKKRPEAHVHELWAPFTDSFTIKSQVKLKCSAGFQRKDIIPNALRLFTRYESASEVTSIRGKVKSVKYGISLWFGLLDDLISKRVSGL